MEFVKQRCLILYGSETGTAEDVAYSIFKAANRRHLDCTIKSMDEYDIMNLPTETFVLFVTSTSGDGEVPYNMKSFWNFLLKKSLSSESLILMNSAVFGLGDSSYDKFNASARRLSKRLLQLGSKELIPVGLGDDQGELGYFSALKVWLDELWKALSLANIIPLIENINDVPELEPAQYIVNIIENESNNDDKLDFLPPNGCKINHNLIIQSPIKGKVKENIRITSIDWNQDVRHLVIDVSSQTTPPFLGGDIATIHPKNSIDNVTRLINIINNVEENKSFTSSTIIEVRKLPINNNRNNRIGNMTCSINNLFLRYLDIAGVPQRGFFEQLSLYSNNNDEKEKLFEISTGDGSDLYYNYCVKERRSYIDVLDEFKSARPPLHRLLELIPPLLPRHYSIASSSIAYPTEVHLCVALVSYRTPYGRKREGICSKYMSNLNLDDEIILWIRSGYFKPPPNNNIPLILVGPGTGVAPMRALIQERNKYLIETKNELNSNQSFNTLLFFGCRKEKSDYLYGAEWNNYCLQTNSIINSDNNNENSIKLNRDILVSIAFSQDQMSKVYVTHKIKLNGKIVWDAIANGGHIFVAGSAKKMPTDVYNSFVDIISEHGEMSKDKADLILKKMQRLGKYIVEAWS